MQLLSKVYAPRPLYEFGVWRGASFKYLIKTFKKGYGFDTFTGLPEDWHVGNGKYEKAGAYSSNGEIPKIEGGEFIAGKFEDTLPIFFSKPRPLASVINFDADLYSSTICALNQSKSVMDKHTVLIFDELIAHKSWEQNEFKALNDFVIKNKFTYEVLAISFFTKQELASKIKRHLKIFLNIASGSVSGPVTRKRTNSIRLLETHLGAHLFVQDAV